MMTTTTIHKSPRNRSATRARTQHLSIILIKSEFATETDALKDPRSLNKYPIDRRTLPNSTLYVEPQHSRTPKWAEFISTGLKIDLDVHTLYGSAVLFIAVDSRRFALTFGFGRNLLKQESIERNFGLKVVLNTVDPEQLRCIDIKSFEDLTIHTRRQTSRGSTLDTFSINTVQDLLRSVAGTPKDPGFAKRVAGSDGLAIAAQLAAQDLPRKCVELLKAYNDTKYKQRFSFIDQLSAVRDSSTIDKLNKELERKLRAKDFARTHLATPEPQDWERIEAFTYSPTREVQYQDLDISQYINDVNQNPTINSLKRHKIGVVCSSSNHSTTRWSVYDSIACEIAVDGHTFVLCGGDWFEVEKEFADRIQRKVKQLAGTLSLPTSKSGEREADYNRRVAAHGAYALMDRKLNNTYRTPVEVCDLFSRTKQFIHVKRRQVSSTLSHLFSQGVISAETFISDEKFRNELRQQLQSTAPAFVGYVPAPNVRPDPSEYEVVYAIITKPDPTWPASLPFFSQLNLVNASDGLIRMGFRVSIVKIDAI